MLDFRTGFPSRLGNALFLAALTFSAIPGEPAGGLQQEDESAVEARKAAAAEAERTQGRTELASRSSAGEAARSLDDRRIVARGAAAATVAHPLFAGLDDATLSAYRINPDTDDAVAVFTGVEVWGAAYDKDSHRVLFSDGVELYEWPVGATATSLLGTVVDTMAANVSMEGLAYHDGVLYASKVSSTGEGEGIYTIDLQTLEATRAIAFADPATTTISGIDADPVTGQLYGTNDDADLRGLVQIDPDGTVTLVTAYPGGETDVDGLAVGGGRAYLITDDQTPPDFSVFDFGTMQYVAGVTSPFVTTEVFAGGAWIEPFLLDIDGNGSVEALTDGLLLLRYSFGFRGLTLVQGAVDLVSCTRCSANEIEAYLGSL